jgi:hypothetical protein
MRAQALATTAVRLAEFSATPADRTLRYIAACLLIFGLLIRLLIGRQPPERLVPICLADDTFYYLRIAEQITAGHGATFDGATATNGYHPLWMVVSVVCVKLTGGAVAAARGLTLLLAFIGAANGLLLWRLVNRHLGALAALWAAGLWSVSPFVVFTEMMGVEAPLMVLFALATLLVYLPWRDDAAARSRRWLTTGVLLGLMLLARTDSILVALLIAADVVCRAARRRPNRLPALRGPALAAGAALVVVSPWLIYNLARFGTIVQDSAAVLIWRERLWWTLSGQPLADKLAAQWRVGFADYFVRLTGLPSAAFVFGLWGLLLGAVGGVRLTSRQKFWDAPRRAVSIIVWWGLVNWVFYIFYFWQQKYWYFLPWHAAWVVLVAAAVDYLWRHTAARRVLALGQALLALALVGGFARVGAGIWTNGFHPWQKTYLEAAAAVRTIAAKEPGRRIGAFNAGVLSAFAALPVVNLDGVVNPDAAEAMRARDLLGYLRAQRIGWVVDHSGLLAAYGDFAGPDWRAAFEPVQRLPTPPFAGDVLIVKVRDATSTPAATPAGQEQP